MWYLVSLVTHLHWPAFSENLLATCSLQQFQVRSNMNTRELNWLSLWQATAECLQDKTLFVQIMFQYSQR